jgi:hypothetical protein
MMLRRLWRLLRLAPTKPKAPPADPRLAADPWLGGIFARLGDRYQLAPDGARILRRTGRARFNPMPVYLDVEKREVHGGFEVRGDPAAARALLDQRVTSQLAAVGLSPAGESVEEWAGTVLTRHYAGHCESPEKAAAAVRLMCEEFELEINLAAE